MARSSRTRVPLTGAVNNIHDNTAIRDHDDDEVGEKDDAEHGSNDGPSTQPGRNPESRSRGIRREDANPQWPPVSEDPIPFANHRSSKDPDLRPLLPYLALGFAPQKLPEHLLKDEYNSGIHALANSLAAAMNLLAVGEHLSVDGIRAMLEGPEYESEVRRFLVEAKRVDKTTGQPFQDHVTEYLAPNKFGTNQLIVLMRLIDMRLGTNFNFGIITEGYRGRYEPLDSDAEAPPAANSGDKPWNPDFVQPHLIYFQQPYRYGPTVWLRNDNAGTIQQNQTGNVSTAEKLLNHWEAMTPEPSLPGRLAVDRWNLLPQTQALVDQGLAMVRESRNIDGDVSKPLVCAGHFVTVVPTPADSPTYGTVIVDIGDPDEFFQTEISNLKIVPYTPNTGLPTEPPIYKPGIPNFRILMVDKAPPDVEGQEEGRYPTINNFNILRGELFHALPDFAVARPKVRRIEGGESGDIDNSRKILGRFEKPWGLDSTQRLVAYPQGMALPLVKLRSNIEGVEGFEKGDVMLVTGKFKGSATGEEGVYCVRDIDGEYATMKREHMERWVIEAFSLRFARPELESELKMLTVKSGFERRAEEGGRKKEMKKAASERRGKRKAVEEQIVPEARGRRTKRAEAVEKVPSKAAGRRKAVEIDAGDEDPEVENVPEAGPSKTRKTTAADKGLNKRKAGDDKNEDASQPGPSKRKKTKDADNEVSDGDAIEDEEEDIVPPRPKKRTKKASGPTGNSQRKTSEEDEFEDPLVPLPEVGQKSSRTSASKVGKRKADKQLPTPKVTKKARTT